MNLAGMIWVIGVQFGEKTLKITNGISSSGKVFSSNCKNSYLRSENANQILVALGCEDMVVVSTPDAVLVTKIDQTRV